MADLLSSLEIGIARTVGAASRLRNQIANIDEYMHAQRQAALHFPTPCHYPNPSPGFSHLAAPSLLRRAVTDANIDPSLQAGGPEAGGMYQAGASAFDYASGVNGVVAGVQAVNGADEQFQFQIPPELLEGWPWPFDTGRGFAGF
jgi:hypothetical protein